MMYENVVLELRRAADKWRANHPSVPTFEIRYDSALFEAADAIEELSKGQKYLSEQVAKWQAEVVKGDCETWLSEQDKPRWVPVTEHLPKEMDRSCGGWSAEFRPSDDVLVWLSHEKRQSVAWYSHTYNEWTTVDENTVYCFGEVTHWKQLAEPPKEEN